MNFRSNLIITKYGLNLRTIEKIKEKYDRDFKKVKQIEKFIKIFYYMKNANIEVCVRLNQKYELESKENNNKSIIDRFTDLFKNNKRGQSFSISDVDEKYLN